MISELYDYVQMDKEEPRMQQFQNSTFIIEICMNDLINQKSGTVYSNTIIDHREKICVVK